MLVFEIDSNYIHFGSLFSTTMIKLRMRPSQNKKFEEGKRNWTTFNMVSNSIFCKGIE